MVLVSIGDSEDGVTVKRVWREGSLIRLESSNPDYPPILLGARDEPPIILGKVTSVVRWHVQTGRRRGPPS